MNCKCDDKGCKKQKDCNCDNDQYNSSYGFMFDYDGNTCDDCKHISKLTGYCRHSKGLPGNRFGKMIKGCDHFK